MEYGLIGKTLVHSFSKIIHEELSSFSYELHSMNEEDLDSFFLEKNFKGINVTIPYKQSVIKYLDHISDEAKKINAVNTIVNKNGILYGYNTDYLGMKKMILDHKIDIKDKVCAILGNGGTHNTATYVLKDLGAKEIITVSRRHENNTISYEELMTRKDIAIILNTTPVGMYPNNDAKLISLSSFKNLEGVIDVIYNPLSTSLIVEAKNLGIKATGGLEMLINQAIYASELFLDKTYPDEISKSIYKKLYLEKANIVLIGMPMSGKTTIGKYLAETYHKSFIDLDEEIVKKANMSIPEIFAKYGEAYFRELEENVTKEFSKMNNLVISTGGGIIKNKTNIDYLKQNGYIVHINRDENLLVYDDNRPLTKNIDEYKKLKQERTILYKSSEDVEIFNNSSVEECSNKIWEAFNESINY